MAKVMGVLVAALVVWALTASAALAEEGRWQQLENNQSCVVWNDYGWRHHLFYLLSNANSV